MDSLRILEEALEAARRLGFQIREEWLDGRAGGACRVRGQKWIFLDLQLAPRERLEQVLAALRADPDHAQLELSPPLRRLLGIPTAA